MQASKKKKYVKDKLDESCTIVDEISKDLKLIEIPKEDIDGKRKDNKRKVSQLRGEARVS